MSLQELTSSGSTTVTIPASTNGDSKTSAVLHRTLREKPNSVIASDGNYLHLDNGQSIFDATGGAAVSCLGHGNERVKQAMMAQVDQNEYCYSLFFSHPPGEKLAKFLVDSTNGVMSKALFVSSGTVHGTERRALYLFNVLLESVLKRKMHTRI